LNTGKQTLMNTEIGLWIDHRNPVAAIVNDEGEGGREITCQMEKHVEYFNETSRDSSSEDVLDR
jgi:hypothetical protein